jgi:hypothetical protein
MHPITAIEITVSIAIVTLLFVIVSIIPKKVRKISLLLASSLTLILILFFVIRPYWINHQVSVKTELLNQYLEKKYPNQEWQIKRKVGRQNNPYHLDVTFENEKGWIYTYLVGDENTICQLSYGVPDGQFPQEGKHYEKTKSCEEYHS